jgi:tripartite-type tricarboxylate transporter receptor subunit TctC
MKIAIRILILLIMAVPPTVLAQTYPNKPIRFVVGYPPGGGNDIVARLIAPKLSEGLGQPVVIENKPGAGTNIAQEIVSKAAPDGYTLLLAPPSVVINKFLYKKLSFDALRDMTGVSNFAYSPNIMVVNPSVPAKTVKEFVALARAKPGHYTFSSSGNGSTQHLSGELFNIRAKVKTLHVPYKGTAPSLTALISGEVDLSYSNIPATLAHIKSGRLRALANTGAKRSELMPDLVTVKESGVDMEIVTWFGVMVPVGTPRAVIDKLAGLLVKMPYTPEMKQRLHDLGAEPIGSTPEEFNKQMRSEETLWAEVVKVSGAKAD